jgi:hypothetical protein
MKLTFTAAELTAIRQTNLKIARLLSELPGTEFIVSQLREQADTPIDPHKIMLDLDSSQVEIYWANDAGDLTIWINPEAVSEALDLVVSQYSIVVEIGVALYPIARLAKRMLKDLGEKFISFGSRFARKADERLGTTVPVIYNGGTSFSQGQIVAVADGVVIRSSFSDIRLYLSAAIDGNGVYYRSKLNDWVSFESDEDAARTLLRDYDVEIMR